MNFRISRDYAEEGTRSSMGGTVKPRTCENYGGITVRGVFALTKNPFPQINENLVIIFCGD